jgi:hypothetical protein
MPFRIIINNYESGSGADVSGVTAEASDVTDGEIFVDATGEEVEGTSTAAADLLDLVETIDGILGGVIS